ncbi:hypothetical protein [Desulfuromonas acetoxidans]|uniref:hypothetical protein n=1 Tax=Desulfuromonas acetoxidans TaxID=891 RepID=UPI00292F48A8|nr:hypothetical protein [Desulfuromonas acetoxidans]
MKLALNLGFAICIFLATSVVSYSEDLSKPYNPTRKEWLDFSIFKAIKTQTDPWKKRISFISWVKEQEGTIYVTLTQANGQGAIDQDTADRYLELVKKNIENILQKYDWSKDMKVHIQFI